MPESVALQVACFFKKSEIDPPDDDYSMREILENLDPDLHSRLQTKFGDKLDQEVNGQRYEVLVRRYYIQITRDYDIIDLDEIEKQIGEQDLRELLFFAKTIAKDECTHDDPPKIKTSEGREKILSTAEELVKKNQDFKKIYDLASEKLGDDFKLVLGVLVQNSFYLHSPTANQRAEEETNRLLRFIRKASHIQKGDSNYFTVDALLNYLLEEHQDVAQGILDEMHTGEYPCPLRELCFRVLLKVRPSKFEKEMELVTGTHVDKVIQMVRHDLNQRTLD